MLKMGGDILGWCSNWRDIWGLRILTAIWSLAMFSITLVLTFKHSEAFVWVTLFSHQIFPSSSFSSPSHLFLLFSNFFKKNYAFYITFQFYRTILWRTFPLFPWVICVTHAFCLLRRDFFLLCSQLFCFGPVMDRSLAGPPTPLLFWLEPAVTS